ncbi:MAG TPA: hypothetical protein DCR65_07455 [Gammaproteobacteria bacterium]|jgi:uncharacterized protein YaeQ|nr:hypothetical protein [Gammaproteobacteria bacterium]
MALRSTVYRCALDVADVDRGYYAAHDLTLARHPSETEARLMLRVLAFALHATDAMEFGRGLSSEDEPDLWDRDETGRIRHWIMLGLPDERRLRRAAGRSDRVTLITYGERALKPWIGREGRALDDIEHLDAWIVKDDELAALAALASRNMAISCTVQDGRAWVSDGSTTVEIEPQVVTSASG